MNAKPKRATRHGGPVKKAPAAAVPGAMSLPREALTELAQIIAKALRQGHNLDTRELPLDAMLAADPDMVLALTDLLADEMRKKRENVHLREAYLLLIGTALSEARMAGEDNVFGPMAQLIDRTRSHLLDAAKSGRLPPDALLAIGQRFAAAKIDFGSDLREMTTTLVQQGVQDQAELPIGSVGDDHAHLAKLLNHDPFEIHAQLSEQFLAVVEAQRVEVVASFVSSAVPSMRGAAVGWLLDPSVTVAQRVAQELSAAATRGLLSPETADRMVMMRPWLPAAVQPDLDAAIRAHRQRGASPAARPIVQIRAVVATGADGSGAQSFFVLLRRGRKLAIAASLVKHGFGLRDAWMRDDLSRRDTDEFIGEVESAMDVFQSSPETIEAAVRNALAVGAEHNETPPFGLVQVLEATGLSRIRPDRIAPEALLPQLLDQVPPARRSAAAIAAALHQSKSWPDQFTFLESWFEPDEAAAEAVSAHKGKKQQVDAVLNGVLPSRRARWAELLAWSAKAAQDEPDGDHWIGFALVANELQGSRPLAEIPLASWIAKNSVAALTGR